jgi:hypothetical protein
MLLKRFYTPRSFLAIDFPKKQGAGKGSARAAAVNNTDYLNKKSPIMPRKAGPEPAVHIPFT